MIIITHVDVYYVLVYGYRYTYTSNPDSNSDIYLILKITCIYLLIDSFMV